MPEARVARTIFDLIGQTQNQPGRQLRSDRLGREVLSTTVAIETIEKRVAGTQPRAFDRTLDLGQIRGNSLRIPSCVK